VWRRADADDAASCTLLWWGWGWVPDVHKTGGQHELHGAPVESALGKGFLLCLNLHACSVFGTAAGGGGGLCGGGLLLLLAPYLYVE
jgi:hypothetical protein